jgi:hypothetical protein
MNTIKSVTRIAVAVKEAAQGKGLHLRSHEWPEVQKAHLKKEPNCAWCGGNKKLNVHHVEPFHFHAEDPVKYPEDKELLDSNLITLCVLEQCHILAGHDDDYKNSAPEVRRNCEKGTFIGLREKTKTRLVEIKRRLYEKADDSRNGAGDVRGDVGGRQASGKDEVGTGRSV